MLFNKLYFFTQDLANGGSVLFQDFWTCVLIIVIHITKYITYMAKRTT